MGGKGGGGGGGGRTGFCYIGARFRRGSSTYRVLKGGSTKPLTLTFPSQQPCIRV